MRNIFDWMAGGRSTRSIQQRRQRSRRAGLGIESLECRAMMSINVAPVYEVSNSWNTGFQAEMRLENHQATNVPAWKLEFDLAANITSIWNAKIASRVGNHYTVVGESWSSSLPAGGKIDFGFVAAGTSAKPTNYLLNGETLGTGGQSPPTLSISDVSQSEGNSGNVPAVFTVSLSAPATSSVQVKYTTVGGTATAGSDFTAASGTLTFAPGETSKKITVQAIGDTQVENDEKFFVDLSAPIGATLAIIRGTGTLKNDDAPPVDPPPVTPPSSSNFQFVVSSDWGSGFTSQLMMRNSGAAALSNWRVEFDFAGSITSIWDAKIVSRTGNHYVVENAGYNSSIAAGATQSFGFNGSRLNAAIVPTNYLLTGTPGGGSTGGGSSGGSGGTSGANRAPVAIADVAYTSPGQAVVINVLANDSDPDNDAITVSAAGAAAHGTVALQADSTIKYTPQAGYTGADSFSYTIKDARGLTSSESVSVNITAVGDWPAHVYAPYVDMGLYPVYDLVNAAQAQGIKYFTLAFVTADPQGAPSWGGYSEYKLGTEYDAQMRQQIAGVRALGGDVIVSFGGASGRELAQVIPNTAALAQAYQSVINAYSLTHIDFDIEGAAVAERASVDRRNDAIAILQANAAAAGKTLHVSYTLPVLPTGLTADGLYLVQSAAQRNVNVGVVNVMAMDYGDSAAPNPQGKMGQYAIAAAESLFTQLKGVYGSTTSDAQLWSMVGVTPMIGLNDVITETFDQQAANELLTFARQKGIGRLSMWSLNRDRQNANGAIGYVDLQSSSLVQQPFEFSQIFLPFTGWWKNSSSSDEKTSPVTEDVLSDNSVRYASGPLEAGQVA